MVHKLSVDGRLPKFSKTAPFGLSLSNGERTVFQQPLTVINDGVLGKRRSQELFALIEMNYNMVDSGEQNHVFERK